MKKKLTLDADRLRVESFGTDDGAAARGTVYGKDDSDCFTYSCQGTCGASPPSFQAVERERPTNAQLTLCLACCV
ncbi:MAG TPA: hypothetical protein VFQ39_05590 [Longimicrobium sp.]|nr:hypothetical protein [Longimicrobium sp.]